MMNMEFLDQVYFQNTVAAYLQSLLLFAAGVAGVWIVEKIFVSRLRKAAEKSATTLDDDLIRLVEKALLPVLYVGVFYLAAHRLVLSGKASFLIHAASIAVWTILLTRLAAMSLILVLRRAWIDREVKPDGVRASQSILFIVKIVVWGIGLTLLLDNLGFNVAAVIAGLGVGGVAVALAAQTILGDLFNYFVIFFDKPFEEGDFIIIGEFLGVIEHIGLKTTRIRSLGGEQLVFSNSDLTSSRVRNYKRMERRRVLFKIGVTYQTPPEKLRTAVKQIRNCIESMEDTVFDRAHFQSFGDFSLNLEVVYYILSSDYNRYMDVQQAINLRIMEMFEKEGIEFAYPTQTLFLNQEKGAGGSEARPF